MIETDRLLLRPWRENDGPGFVRAINTPEVMEHLGGVQEPNQMLRLVEREQDLQAQRGHCFWIVERKEDGALLGLCGLKIGTVEPILGDIEIGWRLRADAWGRGYAREGAEASLAWGWKNLAAPRIVAITTPGNVRSWGLMERLGMVRHPDLDFAHPEFALHHPLSLHVTYAAERP